MVEQLPVVAVMVALLVAMVGGVTALQYLERALARAGAPWWLLPLALVVLMVAVRWWVS